MARRPNVCTYEETIEEDSDAIDFPCDPAFNDNLILAEGDSWFTIGGHTLKTPGIQIHCFPYVSKKTP